MKQTIFTAILITGGIILAQQNSFVTMTAIVVTLALIINDLARNRV